jgi:4-amino-4-deoxy-L-arabinose transferase-like glycosyltransferase
LTYSWGVKETDSLKIELFMTGLKRSIQGTNGARARTTTRRSLLHALIGLWVFTLAFGVAAWRLDQAPDLFADEIVYTRAGIRAATDGVLIFDVGTPLFVHPPLYFLTEAAFLRLTTDPAPVARTPGNIFYWVYHARNLNALFAGLTAVVLYWIGLRLRGLALGILLAALFVFDPFGLRTNRRAMLETMTTLLLVAGMAVLLTPRGRLSASRGLLAGALLGGAMLTKELAFTAPLAVLVYWLLGRGRMWWEQRRNHRAAVAVERVPGERPSLARRVMGTLERDPVLLSLVIAAFTYLIFPWWAITSSHPTFESVTRGLTTGHWGFFFQEKVLSLQRLFGFVQITGWNRPGVSFTDLFLLRLPDYATSYLLFALGGLAAFWLAVMHRHERAGRFLGTWGLVLYAVYFFLAVAGAGNDQFFYMLLVPAIIFVGYAAAVVPEDIEHLRAQPPTLLQRLRLARPAGRSVSLPGLRYGWTRAMRSALVLVLLYNLFGWLKNYAIGVDNGYEKIAAYIHENIPFHEPVNASGDRDKYWFMFPERHITDAGTLEEARDDGVRFFVIAPKDIELGYGRQTPELAEYVMANGELLLSTTGNTFGDIFLYRFDAVPPPVVPEPAPPMRTFRAADLPNIGPLVLMLIIWAATLATALVVLHRRRLAEAEPDGLVYDADARLEETAPRPVAPVHLRTP